MGVPTLKLLQGEFKEGQTVAVDYKDGKLVFAAVAAPDSAMEAEASGRV